MGLHLHYSLIDIDQPSSNQWIKICSMPCKSFRFDLVYIHYWEWYFCHHSDFIFSYENILNPIIASTIKRKSLQPILSYLYAWMYFYYIFSLKSRLIIWGALIVNVDIFCIIQNNLRYIVNDKIRTKYRRDTQTSFAYSHMAMISLQFSIV